MLKAFTALLSNGFAFIPIIQTELLFVDLFNIKKDDLKVTLLFLF